ncbi:hypothetical protein M0638_27305 [Roseomonas sp. NAR14]|uniref:DUF4160 domain-containing protein n=1 Tax=Roseomonas acroporae TaxID=2937791 RepID=A0A9X2BWR2_9PROT|nr:hypothetical protein [Roseomonas acroporae]MCK8788068.1 hypothetical protein [Roseomonas acroporae]
MDGMDTHLGSAEGQATFGMANLRPDKTGLPFIVFISQRDAAQHDIRVKVSPAPRVRHDQMSSYSIRPALHHQTGPVLSTSDERLLNEWVDKNFDVLLGYWNGDIEYTEDAMDLLQPIPKRSAH